jgi:hypothetical protein
MRKEELSSATGLCGALTRALGNGHSGEFFRCGGMNANSIQDVLKIITVKL